MQQLIFVQIGEIALRSPCGEPLAAVPLYVKATDTPRIGVVDNSTKDICGFFYEHYKKEPRHLQETSPPTDQSTTDLTAQDGTKL